MVVFHMIDTATLGIRRAYNIQKAKYFPMPDYNVSSGTQVEVTIYGKILNDSYMHRWQKGWFWQVTNIINN